MLHKLFPTDDYDSIDDIDFKKEMALGMKAVLFDVDNTLVPHGFPADDHAVSFFRALHDMGYKTCLISNNKEPRVKPFADAVNSPYIYKAGKPSKRGYCEAMNILGTDSLTTLFVGDQLFTDILGAKMAGIKCYLVKPINPREEIQIVLKRIPEKIVLFFYNRMKKRRTGHGRN